MDIFTRFICGWHLGRSLDQGLTLVALKRALQGRAPEIHHSDQGVPYAATDYVLRLQARGTAISMAAVGEPRENGYAERLMRTIKEEEVDLRAIASRSFAGKRGYVSKGQKMARNSSLCFPNPLS